jgi:hypothetical protein
VTQTASRSTVPLTRDQRFELLGGFGPLAIFGVLAGGYVVMAIIGAIPHPPLAVYLILALVFLLIGYQVVQAVRDLASGVVLVDEDVLIHSWRATGFGNDQYGKFERLGTFSLKLRVALSPVSNTRYRMTYSPASKIIWSLDPAE